MDFRKSVTYAAADSSRLRPNTSGIRSRPIASLNNAPNNIADAILTLDYSTEGYELDREMRVIKMRGSGHEQHPYRLEIAPGGLMVGKLAPEQARTRHKGKRMSER